MNIFRGSILRSSENSSHQLEFIDDGIIVINRDGTVVLAAETKEIKESIKKNPNAYEFLSLKGDEILYEGESLNHSGAIAHTPFANCHCHLCQPLAVPGELLVPEGETYTGWLPTTLEFENKAKKDPSIVHKLAREKFLSYIENGITASLEYTTSSEEVARIVLEEAEKAGLKDRVKMGYVAMDQEINFISDGFILEDKAEEALAATENLLKEFGDRVVVIDRFPIACSSELRKKLAASARKYNILYETHVDESQNEQKITQGLYQGRSIIQVLIDDEVLVPGAKVGLAHVIHTSAEDMKKVKNAIDGGCEVSIRLCPNSNHHLGSHWRETEEGERYIQFPLAAWISAGARITMGLDKGAGRGLNIAAEALWERGRKHADWCLDEQGEKQPLSLEALREPTYDMLYQYATFNGLESLGLNASSGLNKGDKANFVVTQSRSLAFGFKKLEELTLENIAGEILESGQDSANIKMVFGDGVRLK